MAIINRRRRTKAPTQQIAETMELDKISGKFVVVRQQPVQAEEPKNYEGRWDSGYQAYLRELVAYKQWLDKVQSIYGTCDVDTASRSFCDADWSALEAWNDYISGMERALLLGQTDIAYSYRLVGLPFHAHSRQPSHPKTAESAGEDAC